MRITHITKFGFIDQSAFQKLF